MSKLVKETISFLFLRKAQRYSSVVCFLLFSLGKEIQADLLISYLI
jgi:hypothetical protein